MFVFVYRILRRHCRLSSRDPLCTGVHSTGQGPFPAIRAGRGSAMAAEHKKGLREEAPGHPDRTGGGTDLPSLPGRPQGYITGSFLPATPAFLTSVSSSTPLSNFATLFASSRS
jgi:hypothetical protein